MERSGARGTVVFSGPEITPPGKREAYWGICLYSTFISKEAFISKNDDSNTETYWFPLVTPLDFKILLSGFS